MTELFSKVREEGLSTKFSFDVSEQEDGLVVEFIQSEFSDFNKWKKPQVLTDLFISRYLLPSAYSRIDNKGTNIKKFILQNFGADLQVVKDIDEMSKSVSRISISLPTSYYPLDRSGLPTTVRRIKNTYLPLLVHINDVDVSMEFMDFGEFGSDAVQVAYDALLKGKKPKVQNDIFYFTGVELLHKELNEDMDELIMN